MTEDEIIERIQVIFKDNFGIDPARVTPEANLYEDLDLDSIDAVDLAINAASVSIDRKCSRVRSSFAASERW